MRQRTYISLIFILLLAIFAGWLTFLSPHINLGPIDKEVKTHLGLDLQGGLRVLLEADVPEGTQVSPDSMNVAKSIIEKRVNALGVAEPLIQIQGDQRIVVELPGIANPDEAIKVFGGTGLLEFIDAGSTPITEGQTIATTGQTPDNSCSNLLPGNATPTPAFTPSSSIAPGTTITATAEITNTEGVTSTQVFTTVMTGDCLAGATAAFDPNTNIPEVSFSLQSKGATIFGDFTKANVGKYLAIALDKKIISSPQIQTAITTGEGRITGRFTTEEANNLAIQLKFGALPVPLRIATTTNIGPTLGQDSVQRSIIAGIIGLLVVSIFMIFYYRLLGVLAVIALFIYGLIVFAIYKAGIPLVFPYVTLTLPGIAGFILSLGVAVDANILIFERLKEELRAGRPLSSAVEAGFDRAWPSIRDSNSSTLITSLILLWFGSTFGASIVAGFALTLGIGVLVSLFTAVFVTRTLLRFTLDFGFSHNIWLYGINRRQPELTGSPGEVGV